jgi:6-phosphogluconolactonase
VTNGVVRQTRQSWALGTPLILGLLLLTGCDGGSSSGSSSSSSGSSSSSSGSGSSSSGSGSSSSSSSSGGGSSGAVAGGAVFLFSNFDDDFASFSINPASGVLSQQGGVSPCGEGQERAIAIDPSGQFLYNETSFSGSNGSGGAFGGYSVSVCSIDPSTGALTYVPASVTSPLPGSSASMAIDNSGRLLFLGAQIYTRDSTSGLLTPVAGSAPVPDSGSFLSTAGSEYLYAGTNDSDGNIYSPVLYAYSVDVATGTLTAVAGSPFPLPVENAMLPIGDVTVAADPANSLVFASSQTGLTIFQVDSSTGALTLLTSLSTPYFNEMLVDSVHGRLFATNSVYSDNSGSVYVYNISSGAVLTPAAGSPNLLGLGPFALDPSGTFLYALSVESDAGANTVSAYAVDAVTGAFTAISGSPYSLPTIPFYSANEDFQAGGLIVF